MTDVQLAQLIKDNVEQPVANVLVLAKKTVQTHNEQGIYLGDKYVLEESKKKEPMYIIASSEDSKYKVGDKVRVYSFMEMKPPLASTVEGYELVICREHDVLTVIKK